MNRPSTSSRENPNVIWVRSLVPNEKNSATSAISPAIERGAGRLDHRADEVVDRARLRRANVTSATSRTQPSSERELGSVTMSGIMISTLGSPPARLRASAASRIARACMR